MQIISLKEAKKLIGTRLYWLEQGSHWQRIRSGMLTGVFRKQICFDDNEDYMPLGDFNKLSTTKNERQHDYA